MSLDVKQEPEWIKLYHDHEIQQDLVLGPVLLQPRDVAYALDGIQIKAEYIEDESQDVKNSDKSLTDTQKYEYTEVQTGNQLQCKTVVKRVLRKSIRKNGDKKEKLSEYIKTEDTNNLSSHSLVQPKGGKVRSKKKKNKVRKPKNTHECDYCGKQFPYKSALIIHIRIHTGEKPYTCKICSKKFSNQAGSIKHWKVHTGVKQHTCDVCGKKFNERYLMKNHQRIHSGEQPYTCTECPKTFGNYSNFKRHLLTHLHKYLCDICKQEFKRKSRLTSHIINHMKPKRFPCKYCDKAFMRRGYLKRHLVIHMGSEVFACRVCGKKFSQLASLKKHASKKVCQKKITLEN